MSSKTVEEAVLESVRDDMSDTRVKERDLHIDSINYRHSEMVARKKMKEVAQNVDVTKPNPDRVRKIKEANEQYFELVKDSKLFLNNEDFNVRISYFPKNLILLTASTGEGKSTTAANLAYHALCSGQKVLMITNEEAVEDSYNRVTCLIKNWAYTDHASLSKHQIDTLTNYIEILESRMKVIDDKYTTSMGGQTTTLEGITSILESLLDKDIKFDVIIIDYYQNVSTSLENPSLVDWQVQQKLAGFLDNFKNVYMAPIILLAQKKPNKDDKISYKESIEGRKIILNKATCAIDINAERELKRTSWTIKKGRFSEFLNDVIYTGYKNGRFVKYTPEFMNEVEIEKQNKERNQRLRGVSASRTLGD